MVDDGRPVLIQHLPGAGGVGVAVPEGPLQVVRHLLLHLLPCAGGEGGVVLKEGAHGEQGAGQLPADGVPHLGGRPPAAQGLERHLIAVDGHLVVPDGVATASNCVSILKKSSHTITKASHYQSV